MSPELRKAVETLETKAKQTLQPQDRVIEALQEAGALRAAATLRSLIEQDSVRKAEALAEAARVRQHSRK